MNINLIVCLSGIVIWIFVFALMNFKISAQKKSLSTKGKSVPKAEASFSASLCLTVLVELLPLIIPMKFMAELIAGLCGILGAYIVLNERLENLKKADSE